MPKYIDAEKLEKDGWWASRTYRQDATTAVYETKKMTDFPTADVVVKAPRWIPVMERLPENDDWQIVTIKDESADAPYIYSDFGWYLDVANCWIVDADQRRDIVAWIPLPEPWKGEDDE